MPISKLDAITSNQSRIHNQANNQDSQIDITVDTEQKQANYKQNSEYLEVNNTKSVKIVNDEEIDNVTQHSKDKLNLENIPKKGGVNQVNTILKRRSTSNDYYLSPVVLKIFSLCPLRVPLARKPSRGKFKNKIIVNKRN